jgi:hypothetical protein
MKLALVFLLLTMLACGKAPVTTTGTPTFTTGLPVSCDWKYFPSGSSSCCQVGNDQNGGEEWHVIDIPGKPNGLGHRYLGKACSTLAFGPCGAAKDPLEDPLWINGTGTTIFRPASGTGCGYQVTNAGNTISFPEQYTDQATYPGVTAGCYFTGCSGNTPFFILNITVNVAAGSSLGRVLSDPPGITLSGAGEASGSFPGNVTLIAEPTGRHVRAVFSGACNKTGEYGERAECIVKPAPDPKVSVTLECEKGFTCGRGSKD